MATDLITVLESDSAEIDAVAHALEISTREAMLARSEPASGRQHQLIDELTAEHDALAERIGWTPTTTDSINCGDAVHALRAYRAAESPSRFIAAAVIRRLVDAVETMRHVEQLPEPVGPEL